MEVLQNGNLNVPRVGVIRMRKMQGAEKEGAGSVQTFVTNPEFLKQYSSLRIMPHRLKDNKQPKQTVN